MALMALIGTGLAVQIAGFYQSGEVRLGRWVLRRAISPFGFWLVIVWFGVTVAGTAIGIVQIAWDDLFAR
jgi:hypothetical protein